MLDLIGGTMDRMIEYLEDSSKDGEAVVKAKNMFQLMALDVIAKVIK